MWKGNGSRVVENGVFKTDFLGSGFSGRGSLFPCNSLLLLEFSPFELLVLTIRLEIICFGANVPA